MPIDEIPKEEQRKHTAINLFFNMLMAALTAGAMTGFLMWGYFHDEMEAVEARHEEELHRAMQLSGQVDSYARPAFWPPCRNCKERLSYRLVDLDKELYACSECGSVFTGLDEWGKAIINSFRAAREQRALGEKEKLERAKLEMLELLRRKKKRREF